MEKLITPTISSNFIKEDRAVIKKPVLINKETVLKNSFNMVARISTHNKIKFCNKDFITVSGYKEKELLNNDFSLIDHPEMPKIIVDYINYFIDKGEATSVIIKNKTKKGQYFWTLSTFKPNKGGNYNIAYRIESVKIPKAATEKIDKLYNCLYKLERKINETTALKYLIGYLEEEQMSLTSYSKYLTTL